MSARINTRNMLLARLVLIAQLLAMCGLLVPSAAERGALTAEAQQQLNAYVRHVAWAESLVGTTIAQGNLEVLQFLPKRAHQALYQQVKASLQAAQASAQEHPLRQNSLLQVDELVANAPVLFTSVFTGAGANGVMELLGAGNFGSVFKVKELESGTVYALKLVGYSKDKPMFSQGADQAAQAAIEERKAGGFDATAQLARELTVYMQFMRFPAQRLPLHIVKYERALVAEPTAPWDAQKYRLYKLQPAEELRHAELYRGALMEFCEGPNGINTLEAAQMADVDAVDVQARALYLLDAFRGVQELHHRLHFQHRDLKPDNVLICAGGAQYGGRQYVAKVADLGHGRNDARYHFKSAAEAFQAWRQARVSLAPHGHPSAIAPEVIDVGYTTGLLDAYALGVTALCVLEGPASDQCHEVQHRNSERGHQWKAEPKSAADLQAQITANIQDCATQRSPQTVLNLPNVPASERPKVNQLLLGALACDPMKEGARLPIGTLVNGMKAIVDSLPEQGAADVKQEVKQEAADVKQEVKQAPANQANNGYIPLRMGAAKDAPKEAPKAAPANGQANNGYIPLRMGANRAAPANNGYIPLRMRH